MITLLQGDCRDVLKTLPACSVHCAVTSPPYFGLRSYGVGAENGELGSEASPEEYIATMVQVFRHIKRVLRDDGTIFCNMGDGYQDKQLLMMPARLALALQADGWWLRSEIVWAKPNPMPESIRDRPTSAHEKVYLLAKQPRYFYDAGAVREESITNDPRRPYTSEGAKQLDGRAEWKSGQRRDGEDFSSRNLRNVWTIASYPFSELAETSRQVRVERDAPADGKKRKASPDCPVHGDRPAQVPTLSDDGRVSDQSGRTGRSDNRHAQVLPRGSVPTGQPRELETAASMLDLLGQSYDLSAKGRSIQSRKTDLAPATSPACSVSAQTADDTGCTPGSPSLSGSADHTLGSKSEAHGSGDDRSSQTASHIADTIHETALSSASDPSHCTCEWYIEVTEKTSHFATFPPELAERCIRAGTSERGCCAACGAPWVRSTERMDTGRTQKMADGWDTGDGGHGTVHRLGREQGAGGQPIMANVTTGWSPGCKCDAPTRPCTVLDPFAGVGTVGLVADRLQRDAVLIELNPAYCDMLRKRITSEAPLFANVVQPHDEDPEDLFQADLFLEAAQ